MADAELGQSLEALEKIEARLRLAFDIETVGVLFFDAAGRVTDCNNAFLRMTGFTRDDFDAGNLRWDRVTPRDWLETAANAAHDVFVRGRSEPYEREYLRKDGSRWWGLVAPQWLSPDEGVEFVLDVTDRKRAEADLALYQRQVELEQARRHLRRQLVAAEEEQRKRIARDLHDRLGQHLTAFALELDNARRETNSHPALRRRLERLSDLTRLMTSDARSIALELRPPELDDMGLASAIGTYVSQWTGRYGIPVDLELANMEGRMPPAEQATVLYRILQEGMTNIARHAAATSVSVILERPDGHINLIIEDDGKGFDVGAGMHRAPSERRYGIAGMRERAELAGGELDIESTPGVGTTLFVRLPVDDQPPEDAAI